VTAPQVPPATPAAKQTPRVSCSRCDPPYEFGLLAEKFWSSWFLPLKQRAHREQRSESVIAPLNTIVSQPHSGAPKLIGAVQSIQEIARGVHLHGVPTVTAAPNVPGVAGSWGR